MSKLKDDMILQLSEQWKAVAKDGFHKVDPFWREKLVKWHKGFVRRARWIRFRRWVASLFTTGREI